MGQNPVHSLEFDVDLLRPLKTQEWHDILRQCLDSLLPASLFDQVRIPTLSIIQRKLLSSAQEHTLRVIVKAKTTANTMAAGLHQQMTPTANSVTSGAGLTSGISADQSLSPEWFPPRMANTDEHTHTATQFLVQNLVDQSDAVGKPINSVPQESSGLRVVQHLRSVLESEGRIRCNDSVEIYLPAEYMNIGTGAEGLTTVHSAHTDQNWLVASVCILAFFLITFSAVLFMHCKHRRIIVRKVQYPTPCNSVTVSTVHSCASSTQLMSTYPPPSTVVWTNSHPCSRNPPGTISGFDGPPVYRSAPVCNCACGQSVRPDTAGNRTRPGSSTNYKKYCQNGPGWDSRATYNPGGRTTQLSEAAYRTTSRQHSHLNLVIEPSVQRNPLYHLDRRVPQSRPMGRSVLTNPKAKDYKYLARPANVADQTCQTGSLAGSDVGSDADLDFMMDDPSGGDVAQSSTPDPTRCAMGLEMNVDDNWECGDEKNSDEPPSYNAAVSTDRNCTKCTCQRKNGADKDSTSSDNFTACSGTPTTNCSNGTYKSLKSNFHMVSAPTNQKANPNNDKLIPLQIRKNKGVSGYFGSISQRIPSLTQGYNRKLEIIVDPNAAISSKKKEPGCTDDNASVFSCSDNETSDNECQLSDYECQMEAEHEEITHPSPESVLRTPSNVPVKAPEVSLCPIGEENTSAPEVGKADKKGKDSVGLSPKKDAAADGDDIPAAKAGSQESTLTAFFHALTSEWRNGRPMTVRALKQKSHVKKQIRDGTTTDDITLQPSGSEI